MFINILSYVIQHISQKKNMASPCPAILHRVIAAHAWQLGLLLWDDQPNLSEAKSGWFFQVKMGCETYNNSIVKPLIV